MRPLRPIQQSSSNILPAERNGSVQTLVSMESEPNHRNAMKPLGCPLFVSP